MYVLEGGEKKYADTVSFLRGTLNNDNVRMCTGLWEDSGKAGVWELTELER